MSSPQIPRISRRAFIQLAGAAAAGTILAGAGCSPKPDTRPASTIVPAAPGTPTHVPATAMPHEVPPVLAATSTPGPPVHRRSRQDPRLKDIVRYAPDANSKVVQIHHSGAWSGEDLNPNVLGQILDASITKLTGLNDAMEAWKALFDPGEKIGIKVNSVYFGSTHVALVMAVTEKLKQAGIPPEKILIFDRTSDELATAGFTINRDGPGVRCKGTNGLYTGGRQIVGRDVKLSDLLLDCDALINMPILKNHSYSGMTFAMKNHYGNISMPSEFHTDFMHTLPELNAQDPILDKTRLIIGDILTPGLDKDYRGLEPLGTGDSILMSFDSVAMDATGLEIAEKVQPNWPGRRFMTKMWLDHAVEMGLGTNDPARIDLIDQKIG